MDARREERAEREAERLEALTLARLGEALAREAEQPAACRTCDLAKCKGCKDLRNAEALAARLRAR